jgi:hypothetical protein
MNNRMSILPIAILWSAIATIALPDTFTVTNTSDDGSGSLRQAINDANGHAGLDTISFNIPGSGVHTITPAFPQLPLITSPVVIDGSTQPGFAGLPLIEISGATIGNNGSGLSIDTGGSGSTIRSLVINHGWSLGILLLANNCVIEGCFLGTDPTGTIAFGNTQGIGTAASVTNNLIGGTTAVARNLISGNAIGVLLNNGATNNLIEGNFIGTDITGNNALGNSAGIDLRDSNNVVGGTTAAARNVIGANNTGIRVSSSTGNSIQGNFIGTDVTGTIALGGVGNGIEITAAAQIGGLTATPGTPPGNVISGAQAGGGSGHGIFVQNGISNVVIQGNLIGTDATGTQPLGNGVDGVEIFGAANLIGGTDVMARNVISGNARHGIFLGSNNTSVHDNVIQNNFIGTTIDGTQLLGNGVDGIQAVDSNNNTIGGLTASLGNVIAGNHRAGVGLDSTFGPVSGLSIRSNSIFSNDGLGIDLKLDGVTENDHCDGDPGPNNLQNYPVITSASFGSGFVMLSGTLDSAPNAMFRLEFFSSAACDPSGFGEGQTFLGSTTVMTDGSCSASFGPLMFAISNAHLFVTATATDPSNNTSEFSRCASALVAASRKAHGAAGTFNVDLPLTGTPGIECRAGGATNDYTMVVTFPGNVTVNGNPQAQVTLGTATIGSGGVSNGGMVTVSGNIVTIPLTNVANVQTINVRLNGVNSALADAVSADDVTIPMSVLVGDTNGNGSVNAGDVAQTKGQSGQPVTAANFREDVNANGSVNAGDVALVKSKSGTSLP